MKTITVWKILQTNHPKLETQSEIPRMPPKLLIHITFCETSWFCKWMNRSMEVWQNDQRSLKVKYKPDFFAFFLLCNFIQATYSLYASISSPIKWELPRKIPILLWVQKKKKGVKSMGICSRTTRMQSWQPLKLCSTQPTRRYPETLLSVQKFLTTEKAKWYIVEKKTRCFIEKYEFTWLQNYEPLYYSSHLLNNF